MKKSYTVEDVMQMECHAELINGELVIIDYTTTKHNLAVTAIAYMLDMYIENKGENYEVFTQNVAFYCNELSNYDNDFFLPDVMLVCDSNGIRDDGVHIVPGFIAEVTSEVTKENDYMQKLAVYTSIGVDEYWIVDIQRKLIVRYLKENDYMSDGRLLAA